MHRRFSPLFDRTSEPLVHAGHWGIHPSLVFTSAQFFTSSLTKGDGDPGSVIRKTAFLALVSAT